ncbi:MAG: ABC transporter ATP-binding protein/permease [Defluviitaleaceae bacterium]|nr:ABC transporter ATP-binding protein/permease [Defluviitaleaceae bacterium]
MAVSISIVLSARLTGEMGQAAYGADVQTLLQFLGLLTALMGVQAVSAALSALIVGRFEATAGYRFRDNFARYFLRLPFSKLEKEQTGESLSIYTNDLPLGASFVSRGWFQMVADFIQLIVMFVYMIMLTTSLTLIFFAMFPVLVVMQVLISGPIQKKQITMSERQADFNAIVNDSLQNTSVIAAYSLEEVMKKRYMDAYLLFFQAIKSFIKSMSTMVVSGILVSLSPLLIITTMAASRVIGGQLNIAEYLAFTTLAFQCGGWLMMLSQRLTGFQVSAGGAKRLLDHTTETVDLTLPEPMPALKPDVKESTAVCFTGVDFSYSEEGEAAVSAIDLSIPKGSKVAFVGGSGSGKSTLLKLMLGLYSPTSGQVQVFGQEDVPINAFAYVPQDSFLFPESIGDNITGGGTPDTARLETACKDAGIWDFIQSLPNKFEGVLSESAENVSGGQKQRIALARAFYQNAPIVLFDEATSALDPTTEVEVLTSFETMLSHEPDKTVIMVAHRPKAIAFCDTIVVMAQGKIVGIGKHEELLASCPEYARLEVSNGN